MKKVHVSPLLAGLDLNLLYVFHVVYREKSVSQAAAILSVSQSTVSHAIGRLRTRLGASLFEQQGRGLVPTPMADRLAPEVSAAMLRLEDALAGRQEFDPRRDITHLTVAMPSQLEPLLFPGLFAQLMQRTPGVTVHSVRLDRAGMKRDLDNGVFDVALDAAQPTDPELSSQCLLRDTLRVVAAPGRGPIDRAAYLAARHVAVSSRRHGPSLVDVLLLQDGLRRTIGVRCQRYESACEITATSDLLLTMGSRHAAYLSRTIALSTPQLDMELPSYRVYLYWSRRRDRDPTVLWVRSILGDVSTSMSADGRPASTGARPTG
jgi:DNA-binding transcriptional LysR family regulator